MRPPFYSAAVHQAPQEKDRLPVRPPFVEAAIEPCPKRHLLEKHLLSAVQLNLRKAAAAALVLPTSRASARGWPSRQP